MTSPARSTTPVKTCYTSTWPKSATTTRRTSPASSAGFSNPIDAEIIGNRIYVIEWSGGRGLWEIVLPQATTETAVAEAAGIVPAEFALAQNFPNPFNPSTTIAFQLGLPSQVELAIYSISGQRVRTLISGSLPAGHSPPAMGRPQRARRTRSQRRISYTSYRPATLSPPDSLCYSSELR